MTANLINKGKKQLNVSVYFSIFSYEIYYTQRSILIIKHPYEKTCFLHDNCCYKPVQKCKIYPIYEITNN